MSSILPADIEVGRLLIKFHWQKHATKN